MAINLDSEDRIIRYKMAMTCLMDLLDWQPENRPGIQPHRLSMLLHVIHEDFERALPPRRGGGPVAVNDMEE